MSHNTLRELRRTFVNLSTRLWSSVFIRLMSLASDSRFLRGHHWVGCWCGRDEEAIDTRALTLLIDRTYSAVAARVCSDWEIAAPRYRPPVLVANSESVGALFGRFGITREVRKVADARGTLFAGVIVALGNPLSDEFRGILAHEMCHAMCGVALSPGHSCPWASEGYAHYVEQVTSPHAEGLHHVLFSRLLWTTNCLAHMPLCDLLCATQDEINLGGQRDHATAFVYFLRWLRALEPGAWDLLRKALAPGPGNSPVNGEAVRVETGYDLDELQRLFHSFCNSECERLGVTAAQQQVRTLSGLSKHN